MTGEEMLRIALSGTEAEWDQLHEVCRDRAHAESLARQLEQHATEDSDEASAWANVLNDLHPTIAVTLRPA